MTLQCPNFTAVYWNHHSLFSSYLSLSFRQPHGLSSLFPIFSQINSNTLMPSFLVTPAPSISSLLFHIIYFFSTYVIPVCPPLSFIMSIAKVTVWGVRGTFFFLKKIFLAITLPRDKMVTYAGLSERRRECSRALFNEVSLSNTPFTGPTTDSKPCIRKVKALWGWL